MPGCLGTNQEVLQSSTLRNVDKIQHDSKVRFAKDLLMVNDRLTILESKSTEETPAPLKEGAAMTRRTLEQVLRRNAI